jgi:prolyl 4-hydroxylase
VDAFLEKEECKHIIERSAPNMKKISESRTFSTYLLSAKDDLKLLNIDERVANLTRTPLHYHEQVQVQQYNHGQQYESQLDYKKWKNRLATVFWYLSDVNLGGEMNFPSAVGFEPIDDENVASECSTGLRVKPREGKVRVGLCVILLCSRDRQPTRFTRVQSTDTSAIPLTNALCCSLRLSFSIRCCPMELAIKPVFTANVPSATGRSGQLTSGYGTSSSGCRLGNTTLGEATAVARKTTQQQSVKNRIGYSRSRATSRTI